VISAEELLRLQEQVPQVSVDDALVDYMLAIVEKTRSHESLALGVSPRGGAGAVPRHPGAGRWWKAATT
jgi:MoxR-like ATPase